MTKASSSQPVVILYVMRTHNVTIMYELVFLMSVCFNAFQGSKRHVVILDVDSKDPSLGMSCPPAAFIETSFLSSVANILNPNGKYSMLNLKYALQHCCVGFNIIELDLNCLPLVE